MGAETKPATPFTVEVNRAAVDDYPMSDRADFGDADRGFIAGWDNDQVFNDNGDLIHDGEPLEYIGDDKQAPETVNPSLWRQSQLVRRCGLYKVVDGLYQVRFAVNLTIVDAPDGLVIIDTTTSADLAKAGLALFRRELGNNKPVVAIIYTHTHFDHYAGVKGLVDEADVVSGKIPIVAPGTIESFNKFAIGENVITGNAMSRRMGYTFGLILPQCDCGLVTVGLGSGADNMNIHMTYIPPLSLIHI